MKNLVSFLCCFLIALVLYSQETPVTNMNTHFYHEKSRRQKKTGYILLAGGTALIFIGVTELSHDISLTTSSGDSSDSQAYAVMAITGLAMDIASIGFFISAGKNKQKGLSLQVSSQGIPPRSSPIFVTREQIIPSVRLTYHF